MRFVSQMKRIFLSGYKKSITLAHINQILLKTDPLKNTSAATTTNFRYPELDALRGIASIMVVLFHFTMDRPEAQFGFKLGTTGVDLFFIISGFVIFMSIGRIKKSAEFIINRFCRLYPTYWTVVTFTFILITVASLYKYGNLKVPFSHYLANMSMFQYYFGIPNLDGPYWTMIVEMVFYIFILLLFRFRMLKMFDAVCVLLIGTSLALNFLWNSEPFAKSMIFWFPLFQFLPLFFAGTAFYRIYISKENQIKHYSFVLFCLLAQTALFENAGYSNVYISWPEYGIMLAVFFAIFVLFVNNRLGFIVNRATLFLGKISFALYLIHQWISLEIVIPFLTEAKINFWVASLLIDLPLMLLLAAAVTFYVEIPIGKKLKIKLRQKFIKKNDAILQEKNM